MRKYKGSHFTKLLVDFVCESFLVVHNHINTFVYVSPTFAQTLASLVNGYNFISRKSKFLSKVSISLSVISKSCYPLNSTFFFYSWWHRIAIVSQSNLTLSFKKRLAPSYFQINRVCLRPVCFTIVDISLLDF